MRKALSAFLMGLLVTACTGERWSLAWEEGFDGSVLDTTVWSRTERGTADWNNTQSKRPELLKVRDGMLVKRPILVGEDFVLTGFRQAEWEANI